MALTVLEWRRLLRSPATPWLLLIYLAVPLVAAGLYLVSPDGVRTYSPYEFTQLGSRSLLVLTTWQITLLAMTGPVLTSRLVAGEVEEGTLLPLMASGQSLTGMLLAKLLGVVGFLLIMILTAVPLYAVPLLIGGVSLPLFLRAFLLVVATAVGSAGLGLLYSACGRRAGAVALLGLALGAVITLGGIVLPPSASAREAIERNMMIRDGILPPGTLNRPAALSPWFYPNPLVGLNTAIGQGAPQGVLNLPGVEAAPVLREYRLWQIQVAAAGVIALAAAPLASLILMIRVRWRWPRLLPRVKERMSDG